jgi:hypothetical protein
LADVYEDQLKSQSKAAEQRAEVVVAADCARWLGLQCTAGTIVSFSPNCSFSPVSVSTITAPDASWAVHPDQKAVDSQTDLNSLSAATAFAEKIIVKLRKSSNEAYAALDAYSQRANQALDEEGTRLTLAAARAEETAGDAYMLTFKASIRHGDVKPQDWMASFKRYSSFFGRPSLEATTIDNGPATLTKAQLESASAGLRIAAQMRQSAAVLYSRAGYKFLLAGAIVEAEQALRKAVFADVRFLFRCVAN